MNSAQQLASYVSGNDINNKVNKEYVYNLHKQQLSNGQNNNHQTAEIVNILGGIDKLLSEYLTDNHVQSTISSDQLNEINKLLTTPTLIKPQQICTSKITHYFDENDTFLHSLFGDKKTAKILTILHSKITQIFITISILIMFFSYALNQLIHLLYLIFVCCVLYIPYDLCWILSSNKQAFKLVISSFEFWFKVIYGWICGISLCIWQYQYMIAHHVGYESMGLISVILASVITTNLAIILVSAFDAVKLNKRWKILYSFLFASICMFCAIIAQLMPGDDDYIVNISENASLSTAKIIAHSSRILAIFFCKQAIVTYFRTGRAVSIRHSAYLEWTNRNSPALCNVGTTSIASTTDTNIDSKSNYDHSHDVDDDNIDIVVMPHRKQENMDTTTTQIVNNENNIKQVI